MALQILSIVDKICSSAQKQMSHAVSKIVKGFKQSLFFTSFLPGFLDDMTEDSNIISGNTLLLNKVLSKF